MASSGTRLVLSGLLVRNGRSGGGGSGGGDATDGGKNHTLMRSIGKSS